MAHPRFSVWQAILTALIGLSSLATSPLVARQDHGHGATGNVAPPRVFLDKSRKIVDFQLKRLDNQRLLLVERSADDPRTIPVHEAILVRPGMSASDREQAVQALTAINQSDLVSELLGALERLDAGDRDQQRVSESLSRILLAQPSAALLKQASRFETLVQSEQPLLRINGMAGLLASGSFDGARQLAAGHPQATAALFQALRLIPEPGIRDQFRADIVNVLNDSAPVAVQGAALDALGSINEQPEANFQLAARFINHPELQRVAVEVMTGIDRQFRDPQIATEVAKQLVRRAESTPPADRTGDAFVEAMRLADQLMGQLDQDLANELRARLSKVTVRVILIRTVEEEMRFDTPWFVVESDTDVQIVFQNEDLMPHNLVLTQPGKLQNVALAGAEVGPSIGVSGKQYVPSSPEVLFATEMVQAEKQTRLTFKAPNQPGEYPFVCTFPGHWMRMYGVMVVVDDLASFERNPIPPADPIGSNRAFIRAWTIADFGDRLESNLRGRNDDIGKRIFDEATCATCHRIKAQGKQVGPDLTEVWSRWKGDGTSVLREILEPSHRIEPKYVVRKLITLDGDVISGIVLEETTKSISILPNPESTEPTVVPLDQIEEMVQSSVSLMPKALLDRFSKDEILELVAYLRSVDPTGNPE